MKLRFLFFSIVAAFSTAEGASIGHDKVQPFPQPVPATVSEKAAIKFKPSLRIDDGCHPYPAVNAAGETSGGLKGSGGASDKCKGSGLGSQVYGRAGWHRDLWAIMYAWYFPKDKPPTSVFYRKGHRHDWANVVVWLDNPATENPTVIGVSTGSHASKYIKYTPLAPDAFNGTSPMINYFDYGHNGGLHTVDTTGEGGGEFQDLIMWEQLTDEARNALSTADFGEKAKVPFIDANYEANIDLAWPH